jgi:hypothetical protein
LAAPAAARDNDEIIVTASRYVDRHEDDTLPAATLSRRADFVVMDVTVESDSREPALRQSELQQALAGIEQRVRADGPVSVGLVEEGPQGAAGETRLVPFTQAAAMQTIQAGPRADTSRVRIVLRTPIGAEDTMASCRARLETFFRSVPKPGRVATYSGAPNLSLVNPPQYRPAVVAAIMADGTSALALAGPGHAMEVSGLESRIAWRRSGDLELTLYLPYSLRIRAGTGE